MNAALLTLTIICALGFSKSNAQIYFINSSFEDDSVSSPCSGCVPTGWYSCSACGGVNAIYSGSSVLAASEGNFFTAVTALDTTIADSCAQIKLAQNINCLLRPGRNYYFTIDYASHIAHPIQSGFYQGHSHLQVVGTNDSCGSGQLLYDHYDADTLWHQLTVSFTPSANWNNLLFKQGFPSGESYTGLLDNLSPIYCDNYNEVQITTNDTSLSVGNCIHLFATSSGAYDSVYWKKSDGTIVSNALDGGVVCPSGNTYYVIATRSNDCGSFWSYDTVRVEVPDGVADIEPMRCLLTPTSNNGTFALHSNQSGTLQVFDMNGRKVEEMRFSQGTHTIDVTRLPAGCYLCRMQNAHGVVFRRFVITH